MKMRRIIAGVIALSLVAITLVATAAAFSETIIISAQGRVWQFAPERATSEVTGVSAYYVLNNDPDNEIIIPIKSAAINGKVITIIFDHDVLPDLDPTTFTTGVHYYTATGGDYIASGPGFAWVRTRG